MDRVLVIAAHPDDEVLGVGATINKYVKTGNEITVVYITDGFIALGQDPAIVKKFKRECSKKASAILGVTNIHFLGYPGLLLETVSRAKLAQTLTGLIKELQTNIVYTHYWGDVNHDHQISYEVSMIACRPHRDKIVKKVLAYEVPGSTEWLNKTGVQEFCPNEFNIIDQNHLAKKIEAFNAYSTEVFPYPHPRSPESIKNTARYRGSLINEEFAEVFVSVRTINDKIDTQPQKSTSKKSYSFNTVNPLVASNKIFLGINAEPVDPSVAIVKDGRVLACAEEERFIRYKHAYNVYPIRALKFCLEKAGVSLKDIAGVGVAWDLEAYSNGRMKRFFNSMSEQWTVDPNTIRWQNQMIQSHTLEGAYDFHYKNWRRAFGDIGFPPIHPIAHHHTHAFQSFMQSPFDKAVCITVDGSGDEHCTVIWRCEGEQIIPIREIVMPHSLGWFYAAFTEYLGFRAYDGEYKVMGLAAYGKPDKILLSKIEQVVKPAADGIEYRLDPSFIHYGSHTHSGRFTDKLVELLGRKPRLPDEEITQWHEDLAFAVQKTLETSIERLVLWAIKQTGVKNVCIGGGVGLNVKMNSKIFQLPEVDDVFAHPLCSDTGTAAGAALAVCYKTTGIYPEKLSMLALGPEYSDIEIEKTLKLAQLHYEKYDDICIPVAKELARGRIVAWFQGPLEAGPRALGQRSILADPRSVENRDKVNAIIKFREYWRPFCPSLTEEAMNKYFDKYTEGPYMIISFPANDRLKIDAPAIVHIDGSSRVQAVKQSVLPLYYRLLKSFENETGVPVLLNTSFNIKGEPIVCSIQDALRTFWSTGLDILAIGNFLISKHKNNRQLAD